MPTISTTDHVLDQAKRRLRPSVTNFPGMGLVERRLLNTDFPKIALAEPPPGRDLKTVIGDKGLPIIGHLIEMFRGGPDYLLHMYRKRGPVQYSYSPAMPVVAALGPDAAQAVYSNRNKDFSQQGWVPVIGPFFHRGLMLLDFDEHMFHRRIMQEAFVRSRLVAYTAQVDKVVFPVSIYDAEARLQNFGQVRNAYIRVVDGTLRKGEAIRAMQAGTEADIDDIGFFTPQMTSADELHAGEVGYLITGLKDVTTLRVGDTLTTKAGRAGSAREPLPGYREVKPMVFCGLFPVDSDDYPDLRDALEQQVSTSITMGARVLLGGGPLEGRGYFYEPTIVTQVTTEMPMFCEETFGPAAAVIYARDEEHALELANESDFGLGGNLWTRDIERGRRLARHLESGGVFINGMTASDPRLPFGGVKRSGYGRELSSYGIHEFVNIQTVWIGPAVTSPVKVATE